MTLKLALLLVVAAAFLATASTAGARSAGQVCPSFKQSGVSYRWETIGKGWTCASAKPWVVKLIGDRVHVESKSVPLTNGPRGYHCAANPGSRGGRATAGQCIKGTIAFPQSGFAWFT